MTPSNRKPNKAADVVIIGAGPYGLSIAAHLSAQRVAYRIFGQPMSAWSTQMPEGMRLKSEGFASSLADPNSEFTLRHFCQQQGLSYADRGSPVPLDTFIAYGLEFQRKFVAHLENKLIAGVKQSTDGFELQMEDGERVLARKIVVAVGIGGFGYVPPVLATLPAGFVSHSSAHHNLKDFRSRQVAVVGGGASALDLAALLHESGAAVQLIARKPTIRFHDPPQPRSVRDRLLRPMTGLGPGLKLLFYVHAPLLFRCMPEKFRLDKIRTTLGPAPGWFIKDQVVGKVPFHLGVDITSAVIQNGRVSLELADGEGRKRTVEADHVIAATGYQVDLERLCFLSREIRQKIQTTGKAPALSSNFESSVRGLYFVGAAAANSFGPLMRFAYGAGFTAQRISSHLAKTASQKATSFGKAKYAGPLSAPDAADEALQRN